MSLSGLWENVILTDIIVTTYGTIGCAKSDTNYQKVLAHNFGAGSHTHPVLWDINTRKTLNPRPSAQPPTHKGYGLGMWVTLLSSRRQNSASSSYNTSTPMTQTYTSLQRYGTWTWQHTSILHLQETYQHRPVPQLGGWSQPSC